MILILVTFPFSLLVIVILTSFLVAVFRVLLLMGMVLLCVVALLHLHVLFLGLLVRATLAICLALAMVHLTDIGIAVGRSFQNTWPLPLRIDYFLFGGTLSGATGICVFLDPFV